MSTLTLDRKISRFEPNVSVQRAHSPESLPEVSSSSASAEPPVMGLPLNYAFPEMLVDLMSIMVLDYDEDYIKPTDYALVRTLALLQGAHLRLSNNKFPMGTIYPDGDGGIRIEWVRDRCEVKLIISAQESGKQFIFHKKGKEYGGEYNVTFEQLGNYLYWLMANG